MKNDNFSSPQSALEFMRQKLGKIVPDAELIIKSELVYEINRLKKERGAIILGHNYMEPALFYTVPDIVGDSLMLAQEAAKTDRDPIIFCGVRFMAETAKILNPSKTVLLPAKEAGCSLAASITADDVKALKEFFPKRPVIVYVNTYADVKGEADYSCTSSNAVKLVRSLATNQVTFLPDEYLAKNVAEELGFSVVVAARSPAGGIQIVECPNGLDPHQAGMIAWRGKCEVHEQFTVEDINNARKQFPDVEVVSHPECSPEVVHASDYAGSTTQLVKRVKESKSSRFLILTECSMGDNIIADNPDKEIVRLCSIRCPHMNQITLEDTLHALRANETLIELDETVRKKAYLSVERMIAVNG